VKNHPNALSHDDILKRIGHGNVPLPEGLESATNVADLHPKTKGVFEFWGEVDKLKKDNFQAGEEVAFKTNGDSIFLTTLRKTNIGNFSHLEGGEGER